MRKKILPVVFLKDQLWAYHLLFDEDGGKERGQVEGYILVGDSWPQLRAPGWQMMPDLRSDLGEPSTATHASPRAWGFRLA